MLVDHIVIGTGFSGLAIAHALHRDGAGSIVILERSSEIGGVWARNRYPGCSCDVPSYLYALEDMPPYPWSRRFPKREEIHDYLRTCFRLSGLDRQIRFGHAVESLAWIEDEQRWHGACRSGETFRARFVHAATGQVPRPTMPDIAGLDGFDGTLFHSGDWPEGLDLAGKRVGLIGTGASGVQMAAGIADEAAGLTVFQRNAPYVHPRRDRPFHRWERRLLASSATWRGLYRSWLYWKHEANGIAYFTLRGLLGIVRRNTMRQIRRFLPEGAARRGATPTYAPGCKRVLVNDDYYPALARPHVRLVCEAIDRIEGSAAICADGTRHDLDVLVLATGFDGTRPMPGIEVTGRDGANLHALWDADGTQAFYGTQVHGFPNLFLLIGPNVGLAHNSVLYMMESQVRFIRKAVGWAIASGRPAEVRADVQSRFNRRIGRLLADTVWQTGGCTSWYHDARNRNVGLWPTYTFRFRSELAAISPDSQVGNRTGRTHGAIVG